MIRKELKGSDILPHREPFLFLDRLLSYTEQESVGQVTFGEECDFFRGHFPRYPIVPGVILLEAMCQSAAAGILAAESEIRGGERLGLLLLAGVDKVRFHRPVRPGETFETHAHVIRRGHGMGRFGAQGLVAGELVVEAELTCMERKRENADR